MSSDKVGRPLVMESGWVLGVHNELDATVVVSYAASLEAENAALRAVLRELPGVWVDSTFEAKHIAARETASFAVESIIAIACKRRGVELEDGK